MIRLHTTDVILVQVNVFLINTCRPISLTCVGMEATFITTVINALVIECNISCTLLVCGFHMNHSNIFVAVVRVHDWSSSTGLYIVLDTGVMVLFLHFRISECLYIFQRNLKTLVLDSMFGPYANNLYKFIKHQVL